MSYTVPQGVRKAAQRGLDLRKKQAKSQRSGLTTQEAGALGIGSGVARARDLIGGRVSIDTVRRIHSYFQRHAGNYRLDKGKDPEDDRGYVAGLLWGGEAGRKWAASVLKNEKTKKDQEMARKAPTRKRSLPRRNGRAMRNAHYRAKPNGDILSLYISNDPYTEDYLQDQAYNLLEEYANSGMSFEELGKAIRALESDWPEFEDFVFEYATMYAESLSPDELVSEMFTNSDIEDAQRYMASRLRNYVDSIIPIAPEYLYETLHEDMPRGYMGMELDIPDRPYWWMDNIDKQREAVESWLTRIERPNSPRQAMSKRRPVPNPAHYGGHSNPGHYGGHSNPGHYGGHSNPAHDTSVYGRSPRTTRRPRTRVIPSRTRRDPMRNDEGAAYMEFLREFSGGASTNPPPNKWTRYTGQTAGRNSTVYATSDGQGGSAFIQPYMPRLSIESRRMAGLYERKMGQKVPKGTKYLVMVSDSAGVSGLSAHKTLAAAKKAGASALGMSNPGHAAKKNKPTRSLLPLASSKKAWSGNAARKRLQRFCKLKDGTLSESTLAKAFAHVPNKEDRQKISAYKLPIADAVNGRLVAVPKAIKAADASLDGARGGVKLNPTQKGKARRTVNAYMAKIDRANKGKK